MNKVHTFLSQNTVETYSCQELVTC